jgi:hypothetical protein
VAGGIIQAQTFGRMLFNQQKPALAFHDCRYGDTGFPSIDHV